MLTSLVTPHTKVRFFCIVCLRQVQTLQNEREVDKMMADQKKLQLISDFKSLASMSCELEEKVSMTLMKKLNADSHAPIVMMMMMFVDTETLVTQLEIERSRVCICKHRDLFSGHVSCYLYDSGQASSGIDLAVAV
jgi:hypothetical protein